MRSHQPGFAASIVFRLFIVLAVLSGLFIRVKTASAESTPCPAEPTDMTISYGQAISCAIDVDGDSDLFRFSGSEGETILLQIAWISGSMRPCIELIAPDGSRITACENSFTNRIDTTLTQTGVYTALVDVLTSGTGDYVLSLERLITPSPNAHAIQYGELIAGQVDPVGEFDLFYFDANAGEDIILQIAWHSGSMRPCLQLIAPDNSRIKACANAFSNRIDTSLTQTGTYTILVEVLSLGTGDYALILERLHPKSPAAQTLLWGILTTNEINPAGDLDLYTFKGTNGDNIRLTISWLSGSMRPCLQLVFPDNSRQIACNNAFSNKIERQLDQTGTYVVMADVLSLGTGTYTLELQCIIGICASALDKPLYLPLIAKE